VGVLRQRVRDLEASLEGMGRTVAQLGRRVEVLEDQAGEARDRLDAINAPYPPVPTGSEQF
jgi:hypothetical protein